MNVLKQFGPANRSRVIAVVACAVLLALYNLAAAQDGASASVGEYQVKAAFLYHFAKFVEWPPAKRDTALVVGVLGNDPFGPILDSMFADKTLNAQRFQIRRVADAAEAQRCHIVFVSIEDPVELTEAMRTLSGSAVLTVGETKNFAALGGMIYLFVEENKIRFNINLGAARRSHIAISAQLLRLARSVHGK
jgi:hypothetical protein